MQTRRLSVFGVASGCTRVLQNVAPPQQKKKKFESSEQNTNKRNESVHENDSGVEDASGMESDVEERHVENLIKKYLKFKVNAANQIFNCERRSLLYVRVVEFLCKLIVFQGSLITVLLQ